MKKVLVSLLSIALIGCSQPILSNTSQYSDLDKEYSQFTTEALTQSYLKKKMDKWLSDAKYSKSLVREIEYAKFKHKDLLKDIVALQPIMFDNITANTAVTTKRIESPFENYIEYINPYPSAVTANSATNITTSSFTANWTSNTKATSYKLFVNESEVYSGANTSFDVSNLSFGTTPTYYVKAVNSAGTSPNSNTISVTLNPDTVTALDATSVTQTSFTANWSSLTGATSYKLKIDNGSFVDVGNVTSSNVTGLTIGSSHTYSVQAVNSGGTGSSSNIITVNLNPAVPAIPTTLVATNIGQTSFTANWNAVTNATSYKLKIDTGSFVDVGAVTSFDVTGLTGGSTHNYYVEASNISGTSNTSTARAVTLIPPEPVAITATNVTDNSFTAKWNASNGASSYKLFIDGVEAYTGSNLSYSKTGLSLSTLHSYYVQAINSSGASSNSNTIDVTLIGFMTLTAVQSIGTYGACDWEHFQIGTDHYIAVANYHRDSGNTYNVYSKVYKWNTGTSQFVDFQSIATWGGTSFKHFQIGTKHYLFAANRQSNDSTYNINSVVYEFNTSTTQFVAIQSIPTNGAYNSHFFTIGSNSYLAIGNSNSSSSNIYKWNTTTSQFENLQSIAIDSGKDFKSFTINSEIYIAGNDSKIYKWNNSTNQFDTSTPYQTLDASGYFDLDYFTIGTERYLIFANYYSSGSYNTLSKVYKWNSQTNLFEELQSLNSIGGVAVKYFSIGTEHYAFISNAYNGSSFNISSYIYKWNNSTNKFDTTPYKTISTNGAVYSDFFTIDTNNYLAVTNHMNPSHDINSVIYRFD